MKRKDYSLFYGCLGNGITVCNRNQQEHGDYKKIAHISEGGEIKYYVTGLPQHVISDIESHAEAQGSREMLMEIIREADSYYQMQYGLIIPKTIANKEGNCCKVEARTYYKMQKEYLKKYA